MVRARPHRLKRDDLQGQDGKLNTNKLTSWDQLSALGFIKEAPASSVAGFFAAAAVLFSELFIV